MSSEKPKPPRDTTPKAASKNTSLYFASFAGCVKRAIVFTALAGLIPRHTATRVIQRLHLEAA
ncbi:hypothetical protein [Polaromonas sp.]|uniref:hypothetical protein n=1 Tax=Polaromonas sp. TaxID=1869339 RepID=UPI00248A6129|nr:hypothetical protein [Polaromonas sp.]MDI1339359.1 hypothetical protein [Polaromonas sp.]